MSEPIKLYLDEDAQSTDLIQALRARQIDVFTVSEVGLLGEADDVHLQYATEHGWVIFTFNRGDFFHLHTQWLRNNKHHAGIIVSDQVGIGVILRRLLRLIDQKSADEMTDWLEFLSNWR
jgi:hypothetical protein